MESHHITALKIASFACMLLLAVTALICILTTSPSWSAGQRARYVPRYTSEKEIRGPTFHIHRNVRLDTEMKNYHMTSVRYAGVTPSGKRRQITARKGNPRADEEESSLLTQLLFQASGQESTPQSVPDNMAGPRPVHPKFQLQARYTAGHSTKPVASWFAIVASWWAGEEPEEDSTILGGAHISEPTK